MRTMRSDLASMAKSGGGLPRFENVKVEGISRETKAPVSVPGAAVGPVRMQVPAPQAPVQNTASVAEARGQRSAVTVLIVIAALAVLGGIGYFAYRTFFAGVAENAGTGSVASQSAGNTGTASGVSGAVTTATPAPTPVPSVTPFTHVSLFTAKPADQVLILALSSSGAGATTAADLETFDQRLSSLLATAKKASTMIEVDVKDANGNDMSIGNILTQENAAVLAPSFLAANFSPDATFFVYRDANGFWPGYVLALQAGESPAALQGGVAQMESSSNIANLFLNNPGAQSPDGFTDSTVGSANVRILPFLDATPPAYFIYGWSGNDLIISTSQGGFEAALNGL